LELLDGFKRWSAARQIAGMTLSVRVLEVDEPTAKAAILGLNRDQTLASTTSTSRAKAAGVSISSAACPATRVGNI
jgi:hypothetical protein